MKKVTAILIGAGLRGRIAYSSYALKHPDEFQVIAVAEPDDTRRTEFAKQHGIPLEMQFADYKELLNKEKLADCAMICTQDKMHFEPTILALQKGYHVLCEKPMSPSKTEIVEMGKASKKYDRILSICHVLRYSPFFVKIKELLEQQSIGKVMSIQHIEKVGYWHYAHSYVRGNWRRADESSPMIMAKCCYDLDILAWLVDSKCTTIQSFGERSRFKEENAPKNAPNYCMDGCEHRDTCPYYAPKFYFEHEYAVGFVHAVSEDVCPESLSQALRKGPYGRCVYHCDNDVVDHQIVNMQFENGVTATLTMSAFTSQCSREIHIMGTLGELKGNMDDATIELRSFVDGSVQCIRLDTPHVGHGGSDEKMMKDFVHRVAENKPTKTSADQSVESHLMALAAEDSRLHGSVVDLRSYV